MLETAERQIERLESAIEGYQAELYCTRCEINREYLMGEIAEARRNLGYWQRIHTRQEIFRERQLGLK